MAGIALGWAAWALFWCGRAVSVALGSAGQVSGGGVGLICEFSASVPWSLDFAPGNADLAAWLMGV